jgi:ElaB/YqjD/DUF883 family membrane-anchored ribosome-binding protein
MKRTAVWAVHFSCNDAHRHKDFEMATESETLRKDVQELRAAMEQLTKDVSTISQSLAKDLKGRASETADGLRDSARSAAHQIGEKGRESTETMEQTVRERPFQSLLVAFGAGLLLSQFLRRH